MKKVWIFLGALIFFVIGAGIAGAATGDFQTRQSGNWNAVATWCKFLTGTATFVDGNTAVTGVGTLFTTQLVAGDVLMLQGSTGTIRGTVSSITDNTHLTLTSGANGAGSGAYGKEATPTSADGVITILNGHTVTVTANVTVDQVTVNAGGQVTVNNGVTLTLAAGSGTDLTVDGTLAVSGSVTTSTSCAVTINGTLTLNGTFTVGQTNTIAFASGSNVTISSSGNYYMYPLGTPATLIVSGTVSSSGTMTTSRGNGGAVATIASGGDVTLSDSATWTLSGAINATLVTTSGGTLAIGPSAKVTGIGEFTLNSGGNLKIGSTAGITSSGASGNIQSSGARTFDAGANYTYNGTAAQVTGNGLPSTVNNLIINNSAGVTLTAGVTVSDTIALTSGNLTTGSNKLTMAISATSSGATDVVGNVYRSYAFDTGTAYDFGNPYVTINFASGTLPTAINMNLVLSAPGDFTQAVTRTYTITPTGGSSYSAMVRLHYLDSELNGNTEENLGLYRKDGSWTYWGRTGNDTTDNYVELSGVTQLSDWTLAEYSKNPTVVKLISFTAKSYNDNVLLQWKTGYEFDNLGFDIFREEDGELYRLNPELIPGSAFIAGSGVTIGSGRSYQWRDTSLSPQASSLSTVKYWLEDFDLNGKRKMHGPVKPVVSNDPLPQKVNTELLSEFRMREERRYEDFRRIQELKEKIGQRPPMGASPLATSNSSVQTLTVQAPRVSGNLETSKAAPAALAPVTQQDRDTQWYMASSPALKILVKEEGWYRVSQPELVKAGLNSNINPKYLQLFVDGKEQPIRVVGESDRKFDPQDAIEFYGTGLDTPSTDTRVYWLLVGSRLGKRIQPFTGQGSLGAPLSFPFAVEKKPRTYYFTALRNGDESNFFGPFVWQTPLDELITISHLDLAVKGNAVLEVALQGGTNLPHKVRVMVNHKEVGRMEFSNQGRGVVTIPISQSLFIVDNEGNGDNLITLEPLGGQMDVSLLDYIRLTYWHTYKAEDDSLGFTAQGGKRISISGFTTSNIRVVDITDPTNFFEVAGRVKAEGGGYSITFGVPGSGNRALLAFTEGRIQQPAGVVKNQASSWHRSGLAYDFVMIGHRDFLQRPGPLEDLEALRKSQGLLVALIDVEDIYDEFNFGVKSPQAIRDFLKLTRTQWSKPPRFVLLVGDASVDPRNYLGLGDFDFVPTKLIDTYYNETASDDWFVDFDGDGIPEMAIGRLPVRTADEAKNMVLKIVNYEGLGGMNEVLLVADENDVNESYDFEAASVEVEALLLQAGVSVKEIFRGVLGSNTEQVLLFDLYQGPMLVNYIGHGSEAMWGGDLLTSDKAEALMNGLNGKRLPFFVNMTCLNGFFHDIYMDSLAEALLKADNGGAVAVWSSSGLTELAGQVVMNKELIRLLFNGEHLTIGEATAIAKEAVTDMDIRRTWILFGDPTIKLK